MTDTPDAEALAMLSRLQHELAECEVEPRSECDWCQRAQAFIDEITAHAATRAEYFEQLTAEKELHATTRAALATVQEERDIIDDFCTTAHMALNAAGVTQTGKVAERITALVAERNALQAELDAERTRAEMWAQASEVHDAALCRELEVLRAEVERLTAELEKGR